MILGEVYVWGKGTTSVNEVNLTYGGNTLKTNFTQDAAKEVSDLWMCFAQACLCKTSTQLLKVITRAKTELQTVVFDTNLILFLPHIYLYVIILARCHYIILNNLPYKSI